MADVIGTTLAVVSLVLQVAEYVDAVIAGFERIQNAPQELRDFKRSVKRLERQLDLLRAHAHDPDDIFHLEDSEEIHETFTLCRSLFEHNEKHQNQSLFSAIVRSTWSVRNNERLVKYKSRIDDHYLTILIPAWLKLRTSNAGTGQQATSPGGSKHIATIQPTLVPPPVSTNDILRDIARLAEEVRNGHEALVVDEKRRELDQKVRQFRVQLGLPAQEEDFIDRNSLSQLSALRYETAPTRLLLGNAPAKHQQIELERVHIMAREDDARILQYQNHENTIQVTHIVPHGSIPWTLNKDDRLVSFRTPHAITIVDSEGYHNYHVDPRYEFRDQIASDRFQSTLRERDLCGTFLAVHIREAGNYLARRQVIRLWQRRIANGLSTIVTMTFLKTSTRDSGHREVNLADYGGSAMFHSRAGARRKESRTLDIIPRESTTGNSQRRMGTLEIQFESVEEAIQFKQLFARLHTTTMSFQSPNVTVQPVESQAPSMTISPVELHVNHPQEVQGSDSFIYELAAESHPPSLIASIAPQIPMPFDSDKDVGWDSFCDRLRQGSWDDNHGYGYT
ncbi:hypothetical protein BD289DRAFT_478666 [Coniella lustricola]|uniref:Fungal N-terminal domain-containing protein n=1 Tax=Coniella lustricola TaxID=2025994 RepID=A0A2T3ALE2_9PEZI|nr:hypothetical protein BD289DRAFT_478666 [Coniella lustricola]